MSYSFVSWVRSGLLADQAAVDTPPGELHSRTTIPVTLRINDREAYDVTRRLSVAGPGDVIGIDPREIVRTDPRNGATDFPPNLFVSIEFDRPDFPWLFTPAVAESRTSPLRPWIILAAVRKSVARLVSEPARPLAVLTCPVSELPDLADSHLWAHAAYTGSLETMDLEEALAARPNQSVSRLLCPRRLEPNGGGRDGGYYACVVPAFDVGVRAGLDERYDPGDDAPVRPAWSVVDRDAIVVLPVYYHWEFDTGQTGDFEDAIAGLKFLDSVPSTAVPFMDAGRPHPRMPDRGELRLALGSALRVAEGSPSAPTPADTEAYAQLKQDMADALVQSVDARDEIDPPVYGRMHAAGDDSARLVDASSGPPWLGELNLEPRHRVAAALGARIVQEQQESLMAAAWQQAGRVADVNRWLRQKQLAREVTSSLYEKRLRTFTLPTLLQITNPVVATAVVGDSTSRGRVAPAPGNPVGRAMVSAPFRRLARQSGRIGRPPAAASKIRIAAAGDGATAAAKPSPLTAAPRAGNVGRLLTDVIVHGKPSFDIIGKPAAPAPVTTQPPPGEPGGEPPADPLAIEAAIAARVLKGLNPRDTFAHEGRSRVSSSSGDLPARSDPLDEIWMTPTFTAPMYQELTALSPDALLPGLGQLTDNSVVLLEADRAFIEAFMVGLNHEMGRELLWREFPTSLRGTYFQQFWDRTTQITATLVSDERSNQLDIPPIDAWKAELGWNMPGAAGSSLFFLLIKGDLLLRFPTAVIYAARAKWLMEGNQYVLQEGEYIPVVDETPSATIHPQLRLHPTPGVTMLAFDFTTAGVAVTPNTIAGQDGSPGDPGWFFVFQEHPAEPRFGLDVSGSVMRTWRDLSWNDVTLRADGSGYLAAAAGRPALAPLEADAGTEQQQRRRVDEAVEWASSSSAMAYVCLQLPFRLEVHAGYWFTKRS